MYWQESCGDSIVKYCGGVLRVRLVNGIVTIRDAIVRLLWKAVSIALIFVLRPINITELINLTSILIGVY